MLLGATVAQPTGCQFMRPVAGFCGKQKRDEFEAERAIVALYRAFRLSFLMSPDSKAAAQSKTLAKSPAKSLTGVRLRKHADYARAYASSRKRQSASMSWFVAPQTPDAAGALPAPRVGLTVGKVIGKAHERNRIKRRMREALRRHVDLLPAGCDLIFHPRRVVLTMEFVQLEAEIVRILKQATTEAPTAARQAEARAAAAAS
jgi:ribonuclease P protein component